MDSAKNQRYFGSEATPQALLQGEVGADAEHPMLPWWPLLLPWQQALGGVLLSAEMQLRCAALAVTGRHAQIDG